MLHKLRQRQLDDSGSEIITVLMTIGIVLLIIFSIPDFSMYFQSRTTAQSVASDAARQVAIWGGNDSPINAMPTPVDINALSRMYDSTTGECKLVRCASNPPPTVRCGRIVGTSVQAANTVGSIGVEVGCEVSYTYVPIFPGNPIIMAAGFIKERVVFTEVSLSETGW